MIASVEHVACFAERRKASEKQSSTHVVNVVDWTCVSVVLRVVLHRSVAAAVAGP